MNNPLVDFSFVYEMAENDTLYAHEVISLFLNTVSSGLLKLEELVRNTDDFEAIRRQAHFLKSSSGVIKVKGMQDDLVIIENLARGHSGIERINECLDSCFRFRFAYDCFRKLRQEIQKSPRNLHPINPNEEAQKSNEVE